MQHKAHRQAQGTHIATLDGARGIAASIVFISHAANSGFLPKILGNGFGQQGVMIFFALSGFLMMHLYGNRPFEPLEIRSYGLHRIGRVFPLYLAVVLASWILGVLLHRWVFHLNSITVLMRALAFLSAPNSLWTVPVEVQFYVVFLAIWFFGQKGRFWIAAIGAEALAIGILAVMFWFGLPKPPLLHDLHLFLLGVVLAKIVSSGSTQWHSLLGWLALAIFLLSIPGLRDFTPFPVLQAWPGPVPAKVWTDPLVVLGSAAFFVGALSGAGPFRWLATRSLRFLGDISYGFYIFHFPVLASVAKTLHPGSFGARAACLLLAVTATLGLAWLSRKYFEHPLQQRIIAL